MSKKPLILMFLLLALFSYRDSSCFAQECGNPWGGNPGEISAGAPVTKPEDVRLCLPPGFVPENKDGGIAFSDPNDSKGEQGRLGIAVTVDSKYRKPESSDEYERVKAWLCNLANTSMGTVCSISEINGVFFVLLKGLEIGSHTESYIHMGNGYLLALTAEAPTGESLSRLRMVINGACLP
ncbi:MAG: hypothetical protein FIA94_07515 [Nitrospirae bacterium]|nr:hypothetical protein [Nitrospirota bacterium]